MNLIPHNLMDTFRTIIEIIDKFGVLVILIALLAPTIMALVHILRKSDIQIKIIYPRDQTEKKVSIEDPSQWIQDLIMAIERANMIESDKGS
jgi:hypothetical protein